MNRVYWAWLKAEYHQPPHGGPSGQTPLERLLEDSQLLRSAPEDLDRLMRMKLTRLVGRDRTVRLDGQLLKAQDSFAGETVEILYDPYDPARPVHLRRTGELDEHRLRRLDLETNAQLRRHPGPTPEGEAAASAELVGARGFPIGVHACIIHLEITEGAEPAPGNPLTTADVEVA